jgi:predicted aspartyl protease
LEAQVLLGPSWKILVALGFAAPAAAQPATTMVETVRDAGTAEPAATQDVAFQIDRHARMTVPVLLAGRGPYRFLVDTGADRTAVSTALAAELGLASGRVATLHSVTGTSQVKTANIPALQLTSDGPRSVEAPLLERAHMGADGILGVDLLRSQRVTFDFRSRMISIVPSARRRERDEAGTIVVTGKLRRGHLIVTRASANGTGLTMVLDTGSELSLGNAALRAKLEARRRLGTPEPIEMTSVTGQKLVGEGFFLKRVEVGDVILRDVMIFFSNAPIFRSLDLEDRPAVLLGMNALRAFDKVSIDFTKKQLRMLVPEQANLGPTVSLTARGIRASGRGDSPTAGN